MDTVRVLGQGLDAGGCPSWAPAGGPSYERGGYSRRDHSRSYSSSARSSRLSLGLGPGPNPGRHILVLGISVTLALVLAHGPARARAPHRTLRIPRGALGPDPTVGATVGMILGTADFARPIPKTHDGPKELNCAPPYSAPRQKRFSYIMSSLLTH